jgi:hypothetical protein
MHQTNTNFGKLLIRCNYQRFLSLGTANYEWNKMFYKWNSFDNRKIVALENGEIEKKVAP